MSRAPARPPRPRPARRPGRPRRAQAEATRERILAAAIELIAERGFAATSIDQLCQRAGVVRTAIYWHFGAKEGLVVPVIERVAASWIEEIQAPSTARAIRSRASTASSRACGGSSSSART